MKAEKITVMAGILVIILLGFLIVWNAGIIGVSKSRLEQDARENQKISGDWKMVQAVDENICAMLFYDEAKKDCTYSVYLAHEGISYGYFFHDGGVDSYMTEGTRVVIYDDKGIALLSLNKDRVCRIEVEKNADTQVIQVDPTLPFAVVLPVGCGEIVMYDVQGNIVTLYDTFRG